MCNASGKPVRLTCFNVQFGEGGAGTFSDGKLTTRVNDPVMKDILEPSLQLALGKYFCGA